MGNLSLLNYANAGTGSAWNFSPPGDEIFPAWL
jgi:hypothetical protein